MDGEVVTLQFGPFSNSVGYRFWENYGHYSAAVEDECSAFYADAEGDGRDGGDASDDKAADDLRDAQYRE